MLETILRTLANTPYWAYLIFGYLLFVGIKSSKTQVLHILRIPILAGVFLILSIKRLNNYLGVDDIYSFHIKMISNYLKITIYSAI